MIANGILILFAFLIILTFGHFYAHQVEINAKEKNLSSGIIF
jgi:hypothetical protein